MNAIWHLLQGIWDMLIELIVFLFWDLWRMLGEWLHDAFWIMLNQVIPAPPSQLDSAIVTIHEAVQGMAAMCNWVDGGVVMVALQSVAVFWGIGLIIRIVRIIASFASLGGGLGA